MRKNSPLSLWTPEYLERTFNLFSPVIFGETGAMGTGYHKMKPSVFNKSYSGFRQEPHLRLLPKNCNPAGLQFDSLFSIDLMGNRDSEIIKIVVCALREQEFWLHMLEWFFICTHRDNPPSPPPPKPWTLEPPAQNTKKIDKKLRLHLKFSRSYYYFLVSWAHCTNVSLNLWKSITVTVTVGNTIHNVRHNCEYCFTCKERHTHTPKM